MPAHCEPARTPSPRKGGAMSYLKDHGARHARHRDLLSGASQVPDSAGGHVCGVDDWRRLCRFLVLGCEGGSYYAMERTLTRENAAAVERCIRADGARAVAEIVRVSDEGRAPNSDPALFGLAMAA